MSNVNWGGTSSINWTLEISVCDTRAFQNVWLKLWGGLDRHVKAGVVSCQELPLKGGDHQSIHFLVRFFFSQTLYRFDAKILSLGRWFARIVFRRRWLLRQNAATLWLERLETASWGSVLRESYRKPRWKTPLRLAMVIQWWNRKNCQMFRIMQLQVFQVAGDEAVVSSKTEEAFLSAFSFWCQEQEAEATCVCKNTALLAKILASFSQVKESF